MKTVASVMPPVSLRYAPCRAWRHHSQFVSTRNVLSPASFAGAMLAPENRVKVFAKEMGPVKRDQLNTPKPLRIRQALLRRASSL